MENCVELTGDLFLGTRDCNQPCTISNLAPLSSLQIIRGSFSVECCQALTEITGLTSMRILEGTFRVFYNSALRSISIQSQWQTIRSIEISQNVQLRAITGFPSLLQLSGYLLVNRNPLLTDMSGFSKISVVSGAETVVGQAISVLYNIALPDLSGLSSLRAIGYGTVHIQGNTNLCYAGYPTWSYGSYPARLATGDKGIDWRILLDPVPSWQYTWNQTGVPTLVVQDNGDQETCRKCIVSQPLE